MPENEKSNNEQDGLDSGIRSFLGQEFFHNSLVQWALIGSLFVGLSAISSLAFFVRPVDHPIILHYNVYFGVDMLGEWWGAYLLPGVAVIFLLINLRAAYVFYSRRERIAAYLFLLASLFIQIGVAIGVATIIRINY